MIHDQQQQYPPPPPPPHFVYVSPPPHMYHSDRRPLPCVRISLIVFNSIELAFGICIFIAASVILAQGGNTTKEQQNKELLIGVIVGSVLGIIRSVIALFGVVKYNACALLCTFVWLVILIVLNFLVAIFLILPNEKLTSEFANAMFYNLLIMNTVAYMTWVFRRAVLDYEKMQQGGGMSPHVGMPKVGVPPTPVGPAATPDAMV